MVGDGPETRQHTLGARLQLAEALAPASLRRARGPWCVLGPRTLSSIVGLKKADFFSKGQLSAFTVHQEDGEDNVCYFLEMYLFSRAP